MILDGLKLTFVGMGTVFLFLVLLIVSIIGVSKLIKPYEYLFSDPKQGADGKLKTPVVDNKPLIAAVISAAVYQYRRRKG